MTTCLWMNQSCNGTVKTPLYGVLKKERELRLVSCEPEFELELHAHNLFLYYINTNEIPGELSR